MKLALVGYGKMGKEVEKIAKQRGHEISAFVNAKQPIQQVDLSNTDLAIDFSTPESVIKHIHYLTDKNIPVVVGTTGWNNELKKVEVQIAQTNGALLYASNFSIGVNLFFELNQQLAKMMNRHKEYYVSMKETHHTQKLDAPSGTAITLANDIIEQHDAVDNWSCPQHPTRNEFEGGIEINAQRKSEVFGIHEVNYSSNIDTITIKHEAHNRKGFATGAVIAAEWLINKKGVFTMRDVLSLKI